MRKTLLFAAALCLASTTAMAQTYAAPLQIQPGDNTCQASEPGSYYWKFVADDDYIATIGQYGESETPMVAIESNGSPSYITGVTPLIGLPKSLPCRKARPITSPSMQKQRAK